MDDSHGGNGIFKYQIGGSDIACGGGKRRRPSLENLSVIALSLHCHRRACSLAPACFLCYDPSLPLADTKWSLFGLHFFSIYAVYSVFMRLLEF